MKGDRNYFCKSRGKSTYKLVSKKKKKKKRVTTPVYIYHLNLCIVYILCLTKCLFVQDSFDYYNKKIKLFKTLFFIFK